MHTIKGSSALFGFQHIADFTHEIETVFDLVRDGHISVSKELIERTLQSRDKKIVDPGIVESALVEQLNDPLVHIIRNSIDHGIESPDIRKNKQ